METATGTDLSILALRPACPLPARPPACAPWAQRELAGAEREEPRHSSLPSGQRHLSCPTPSLRPGSGFLVSASPLSIHLLLWGVVALRVSRH